MNQEPDAGEGGSGRRPRVAVVGSSGGNLYSLGGDEPDTLIGEVRRQLEAAGMELYRLQFVASSRSMDGSEARGGASASLLEIIDGEIGTHVIGSLSDVNEVAREADAELARAVASGEIDAMVLISADPDDVNRRVVEAAAERDLPAAGTGGTSVAAAQARGLHFVAASGTTGTTATTRAVSYAAGLASHFGMSYRPILGSAESSEDASGPLGRISLRAIMISSLPAFIALAVILALGKIPGLGVLEEVFTILVEALPVVVAVVAARKVSGLGEVGVVAGVIAGVLSVEGGVIAGILGGILAGVLSNWLLAFSLARRFPATTANILSGGLGGLLSGLIIFFAVAPLAAATGEGIRYAVEWAVEVNGLLAGALAGLLIWPAILGGVYHAAILPVVLLEMERNGNSFFGAIDMVGLVMVAAGITLANIIYPRTRQERAVAVSGFPINVGFGTFVEAAYPFMFADRLVFVGAIVSAGFGGALVGLFDIRGTAYVPSVVAPFVSNDAAVFAGVMVATMALSCAITLLANRRSRVAQRSRKHVPDGSEPS